MANNIKSYMPNARGRFIQGVINPQACKKVITKTEPIIYRSSYELRFIQWLEASPDIVRWDSEAIPITYYIKGQKHTYWPDFYIEMKDGRRALIEVKPKNQTVEPKNKRGKLAKYWSINFNKWQYAKEFCDKRGIDFKIITENTINRLS